MGRNAISPALSLLVSAMMLVGVMAHKFNRTCIDTIVDFGDAHSRVAVTPPNGVFNDFPGLPSTNGPNFVGCLRNSWNITNPSDSNYANCIQTPKYNQLQSSISTPTVWMFAQGGATISDDFVKNPAEGTIPFIKQAKNFVEAVKTNPLNFEKAMAIVVMGMNDIRLAARSYKQYNTPEKLSGDLASSYFEAIDIIRKAGMKNFMVSNVIPTNSLPEFQYMPDEEKDYHREILPMYNAEFVNKLEEYKKAHSECNFIFFDLFKVTNEILDNAEKYGFTETTKSCPYSLLGVGEFKTEDKARNQQKPGCGNIRNYAFVDNVNPTTIFHGLWAKAIMEILDEFTETSDGTDTALSGNIATSKSTISKDGGANAEAVANAVAPSNGRSKKGSIKAAATATAIGSSSSNANAKAIATGQASNETTAKAGAKAIGRSSSKAIANAVATGNAEAIADATAKSGLRTCGESSSGESGACGESTPRSKSGKFDPEESKQDVDNESKPGVQATAVAEASAIGAGTSEAPSAPATCGETGAGQSKTDACEELKPSDTVAIEGIEDEGPCGESHNGPCKPNEPPKTIELTPDPPSSPGDYGESNTNTYKPEPSDDLLTEEDKDEDPESNDQPPIEEYDNEEYNNEDPELNDQLPTEEGKDEDPEPSETATTGTAKNKSPYGDPKLGKSNTDGCEKSKPSGKATAIANATATAHAPNTGVLKTEVPCEESEPGESKLSTYEDSNPSTEVPSNAIDYEEPGSGEPMASTYEEPKPNNGESPNNITKNGSHDWGKQFSTMVGGVVCKINPDLCQEE